MNALADAVRTVNPFGFHVRRGIFSGLAMRHLILVLVFTVGYDVLGQLGLLALTEPSIASRLKNFSQMPVHLAVALFAVLAAVAADNAWKSGTARLLRYPIAILIAAVAGGALTELCAPPVVEHSVEVLAIQAQLPYFHLLLTARRFLASLYICTTVVALYALIEVNHRASEVLHTSRVRALDDERDICAAELSAMQARVDPELLFESLRSVDEAYGVDPSLGQARLDALIRFLRAALPGKTSVTSTVRFEKELAEAYVDLVSRDTTVREHAFFQTNPASLDERMPPMIVLPILRWAIAGAPADGLTISVIRRDAPSEATLKLTVDNCNPGSLKTHDNELEIVKERLQCLYGDKVRIRAEASSDRRLAQVEFPASTT